MDLFMCSFNGQLLLLYTFFSKTAVLQNYWTLDLHTNTVFFFVFFFTWLPTRTQNRDKPIVKV